MSRFHISLLGPLGLRLDDSTEIHLTAPQSQALLAYLAAPDGRAGYGREQLAELFWPEQPARTGRQNLRQALARLQRALKWPPAPKGDLPPLLQVSRQHIRLHPELAIQTDLEIFLAAVATAQEHDHPEIASCPDCVRRLSHGVNLVQGEFLAGLPSISPPFDAWVMTWRERLNQHLAWALGCLTRHALERGNYDAASLYARRHLALVPLDEEACRRAMIALARLGRPQEAAACYQALAQALQEAVQAPPSQETTALYRQICGQATGATDSRPSPTVTGLPVQHTPFVGRRQELAALDAWRDRGRPGLLTLYGPGGMGKTRLAVEWAGRAAARFADGVCFIGLATVDTPDRVLSAIAAGLGLAFQLAGNEPEGHLRQVLATLRERELLLVLDNFEHLLPARDLLARLLAGTEGVWLLVTSRTTLELAGEEKLEIRGLHRPPPPPHRLHQPPVNPDAYDALQLFGRCARRIQPAFHWHAQTLAAASQICQLVGGLPLAIELAAATVRERDVTALAAELSHNLDILATDMPDVPPRHRSLRAIFASSWAILSHGERRAFTRLAIFPGIIDREAAQAVAGVDEAMLERLAAHSFLRRTRPGRYEIHAILRQYGLEQQTARPVLRRRTAERFCRYFAERLATHTPDLFSSRIRQARDAVQADLANLRQAWQLCLAHGWPAFLGRYIPGLSRFYTIAGLSHEGEQLFQQAIQQLQTEPARGGHPGLLGQLLTAQAGCALNLGAFDRCIAQAQAAYDLWLAGHRWPGGAAEALLYWGRALWRLGQPAEARQRLEEGLTLAQEHGQRQQEAEIWLALGDIPLLRGEETGAHSAHACFSQALALFQETGDWYGASSALNSLGFRAAVQGDYETAGHYFERALELYRQIDNRLGQSTVLNNLGNLYALRGDYDRANACLQEVVATARSTGNPIGEVNALVNLGTNALDQEDDQRAANLFCQALEIAQQIGYRRGLGAIYNNLSAIALRRGALATARHYAELSLAEAQATDDRYFEWQRLNVLGNLARLQGQWAAAEAYLQAAQTITQALPAAAAQATLSLSWGLLAESRGDLERARTALRAALTQGQENQEVAVQALLGLSRLALGRGKARVAIQLAQQALEMARTLADGQQVAACLTHLGRAYEAGEEGPAAQAAFEEALSLRRTLQQPHLALEPLAGIARHHLHMGETTAALICAEEIWAQLQVLPPECTWDPEAIYVTCIQAFRAHEDPRAAYVQDAWKQWRAERAAGKISAARSRG
ncbi:MAG: hypothetical protein KatS3mg050_4010 [Litorilinea sp.]|nr:MAG: hypothetical protein KatS3mg050_4010 [Litorilinea sp.]